MELLPFGDIWCCYGDIWCCFSVIKCSFLIYVAVLVI
jgi:hypothetical protein